MSFPIQSAGIAFRLRTEPPACARAVAVGSAPVIRFSVSEEVPTLKNRASCKTYGGPRLAKTLTRPSVEQLQCPGVDVHCIGSAVCENEIQTPSSGTGRECGRCIPA